MYTPQQSYIYHGSKEPFDIAIPKRQIRMKKDANGERQVIFDQVSFHATPYRWIALAYTYDHKPIPGEGDMYFNMGVDLYEHELEIDIYGTGSLEESLRMLYGEGGYVLGFEKQDFFHMEGLGNLEVISTKPVKPVSVERIEDPVYEMRKAGVHFCFIDVMASQ